MPDFEAGRVVTRLVTEGGEQVKQDLRDNERAADEAMKRMEARQKAVGINAATPAGQDAARMMLSQGMPAATVSKFTRIPQAELTKLFGSTVGSPAAVAASRGLDMKALSKFSAVPQAGSMMGKLSDFAATEAKQAAKDNITGAKDETKAKKDLTKQTSEVSKGFGALGKALGSEGMTALKVLGLGGLAAGGVVGGAAAGVGAVRGFGGMANPGAAIRFDRALADAQASLGRGLVPALNYFTDKMRQAGDIVAGNQDKVASGMRLVTGATEFISELTGFNAAAKRNEGKSLGASQWKELGQFFKADDYYKTLAKEFLTQTTPKGGVDEAGQAASDAAARNQGKRLGESIRGERPLIEGVAPFGFGKPTGKDEGGNLIDAKGMPLSPFALPAGSQTQQRAFMQAEGKGEAEINAAISAGAALWEKQFMDAFKKKPQSTPAPAEVAPSGMSLETSVLWGGPGSP